MDIMRRRVGNCVLCERPLSLSFAAPRKVYERRVCALTHSGPTIPNGPGHFDTSDKGKDEGAQQEFGSRLHGA